MDILRIILAIFIPPVAVFLTVGISLHFFISLVLYLLVVSWPLAVIHAFWLILKKK